MNQLDNFDSNFVKATVEEWRIAAEKYQRDAAQAYKKLRSYLTLYQFRLDDAQKCDIREKMELQEMTHKKCTRECQNGAQEGTSRID